MADTMMDKLIDITNQLLDLGKRNRLLNYRDQGLKTLKIINMDIEGIFKDITSGSDRTLFSIDSLINQYLNMNSKPETNEELESMYNFLRENTIDTMKANDLITFKLGYTVLQTLKSLSKEYHFSVDEKGINSLYMTFGFVHYKDEEGIEYDAPLLLVPIELELEGETYVIREYEDEVMLNPTLRYYFSTIYNVEFPEYNYTKLATYYQKLNSVLPLETSLVEGCAIGIYSFYKMNMYNDLMDNKDTVIQNRNVRVLLGEPATSIDAEEEDQPVYPVVNYDSSQYEAIQLAANGNSFCLQGPPGSGKSQTITNIIASLLGRGKKILFVSEKIAALRVVFENLRRAGLSPFAIELHSNKTNKKEFIDDLYNTAVSPKYDVALKTMFLGSKYDNLKLNIRTYERELHSKIPTLGISLLDLYSDYLNMEIEPAIDYKIDVDNINLFDITRITEYFDDYVRYSHFLGRDYRKNKLYGLNQIKSDYVVHSFELDLKASIKLLKVLKNIKFSLNTGNEIAINNVEDAYKYLNFVDRLINLKTYNPHYLIKRNRTRLIDLIESHTSISRKLNASCLANYDQKIITEDIDKLYESFKNSSSGVFHGLNKEYKETLQKILSYRKDKEKDAVILTELEALVAFKKTLVEVNSIEAELTKYFGKIRGLNFQAILVDLKSLEGLSDFYLPVEKYQTLKQSFEDTHLSVDFLVRDKKRLVELARVLDNRDLSILRNPIENVLDRLEDILPSLDHVTSYLNMTHAADELYKLKAIDYLHTYIDSDADIDLLTITYKKLFYKQTIDSVIAKSPLLASFQAQNEESLIDDFRDLDESILDINRDFIISENSRSRPDPKTIIEGSKFKILDKEHSKSRRQLPIRQLLDKIWDLALDVKPVFLMSPLSVSTYLASELNMFDTVIFDEASQIFASDALGSIYRAKQCIVIGDTKQMPPTSFFQANFEDNAGDKEMDLESILDKASANFDTSCLKWHYRSRSEELITFSNKSFYNFDLITIPQAKLHERGFGIDFVYVSDGRYDAQSRTNPVEAQRICDMVFEHVQESDESIGVVAFSNVQAELIADLIDKRLKKFPEYQQYFDKYDDEPVFVKNLENVQGDERDRIIFSICYGYNKEGKFYQRFGPLNGQGGERRLNVAVTRAKFNITVVSSIRYVDINTDSTDSVGVRFLKNYLEFAENVETSKSFDDSDNGVINSIKHYLENLGYEVLPNYGTSSFRIDLAIKKDDKFIMALMIDSKTFSKSLTDKYRLEKLLLERLGWRYYMLYATSWMDHTEEEKERLFEALTSDAETSNPEAKRRKISYLEQDDDAETFEDTFEEYRELSIPNMKEYYDYKGLSYVINELIKTEQPIHEELMIKKLAEMLEKTKITKDFRDEVEANLPSKAVKVLEHYYTFDPDMDIVFRGHSGRDVAYVYPDEVVDAVYQVIDRNKGVSIEGINKTISQVLGLEKTTVTSKKLVDRAIQILEEKGRIFKSEDLNGYCSDKLK